MEQPLSPESSGEARSESPEPEYSNPVVAEGINVSDKKPLRTFCIDLLITAAGILLLVGLFNATATFLTPFIPFGWEEGLIGESVLESGLDDKGRAKQEALRSLAGRIADTMNLPDDMKVRVFYNSSGLVNAFATLGGNVVVFQGLLEVVDSEDALAMVLAHEIAHVKHRDALKGAVQALGFMLLFSGISDSGSHVEGVAGLGMAGYSRSQEEAADASSAEDNSPFSASNATFALNSAVC